MVASGFSQKQGLPAAMAASTYCSCVAPQEVTSTASTSAEAISSSPVAKISASGATSAFTASALSALTSDSATILAPART